MADQIFNVNCGFFDSADGDRLYSASEMNRPYKRVIGNGVFATPTGTPSTDLQVMSAVDPMSVIVKAGDGLFGDKWFYNASDITITVPSNTQLLPRRDSVVIQVDKRTAGRSGNIVYRTGTPASSPVPPEIGTVDNVIEYRLANVYVASGATAINQDAIVDLRGSSECPWVTSLIEQVDTSALFAQWQYAYQNYYNQSTDEFDNYMDNREQAFNDWYSSLTQQLSVATNILTLESTYTSAGTISTIPINIALFDKTTDVLMVYVNRLRATPGVDYTIAANSASITLTSPITAGQSVVFLVLKSVVASDIDSTLSAIEALDARLSTVVADSGWTNFTLENSAQAYSAALTPGVRKYGNQVYLRGCLKNITAVGTIFATLPVGYRPNMARYYTIATGSITVTIEIGTNGQLKVANAIGTLTAASLIPIDSQFIVG